MDDLFDEIDEKFHDKIDYNARVNFSSWCAENYNYHLNFGFKSKIGLKYSESYKIDKLYEIYLKSLSFK